MKWLPSVLLIGGVCLVIVGLAIGLSTTTSLTQAGPNGSHVTVIVTSADTTAWIVAMTGLIAALAGLVTALASLRNSRRTSDARKEDGGDEVGG